jgi:protoporphyrinogen oxidase
LNITIFGGGLSGLSVGASLLKSGHYVTIIERDSSVGGFAKSFSRNGYTFDVGPHIFFGKKTVPKLKEYFNGAEVLIQNSNLKQGICIKNQLFRYPFQLEEILRKIKKRRLLSVVHDILARRNRDHNGGSVGEESLETWVKGKIGPTLFDYIELDNYVQKLYGISAREISSDWGKHRLKPIARMTMWEAVKKRFNPFAKKRKPQTFYGSKCIGEIATHLADYIVKHGGRILLNSSVEEIEMSNGKVKKIYVRRDGKRHSVSSDFVVSSVKISDLIGMIRPAPDPGVRNASGALKYRDLIVLYLVVQKPKILDYCLIYFSPKETTFKRITEFKYFSPEMMPQNETTLALEICADRGNEIWHCQDTEIFERLLTELERLEILGREDVLEYFVLRVPSVYPVYFLNYKSQLKVVLDYLKDVENLVSIGRQGLYQHDNMVTAIESGFSTVGLIENHGDRLQGVGEAVYHERLHKYDDMA